jgi:hypothetical protein
MLWVIDKLRKLCGLVGGLCLLALIVAAISAVRGDHSFPAPLSQTETGFGRYALEVGAMFAGAGIGWVLLTEPGARLVLGRGWRRYLDL